MKAAPGAGPAPGHTLERTKVVYECDRGVVLSAISVANSLLFFLLQATNEGIHAFGHIIRASEAM